MKISRVLYQPYQFHVGIKFGPFKYIEEGYIRGFEKAGCKIALWDGENEEKLKDILNYFKPELFIGYLRRSLDYKNFTWADSSAFDKLNSYRKTSGMKVALHTHPNVQKLMEKLNLKFEDGDPSNAERFYRQPPPPTQAEETLVSENFIDIILHPYSKNLTSICFDYWIDNSIKVMEEPLAADDTINKKTFFPRFKSYHITYIGGWWPFKGQQLDRHLVPLKEHFGDRLRIFGRKWPHLSEGYVADREYRTIVLRSKINLVFHEPSQVQEISVHVNERIFKLYGMGVFAICDNNSCLREYFEDDALVLCSGPEEMIDKCTFYLRNKRERKRIAKKGYNTVKNKHTYFIRAKTLLSAL